MKLQDLTPAEQKLVNTNFGEEIEKEAAAQVEMINECYDYGFGKLAAATADDFDAAMSKQAEEEEKEEKEDKEEEEKKGSDNASEAAAADLGSFIERGFFDGLKKLGSERHNNEMHYLWPFIEEKVAAKGAQSAVKKLYKAVADKAGKAKDAVVDYHKGIGKDVKGAMNSKKGVKDRLTSAGKAALKSTPHAVAATAGTYGLYRALRGGKKEGEQ